MDLNAAHFTFVAPSTGEEESIEVAFRLTVTDDDGAEATDTVVYTVNRVNDAPTAEAGADQSVEGLQTVTLAGQGADSDGSITSYAWTQTGGESVEITGADQASASFAAPSTNSELELEFTLTVTDSDGATASDRIAVKVTPENAPVVELIFPPEQGGFSGTSISAFGSVAAKNEAEIESVEVSAGAGVVIATLDSDGNWRADDVAVPEGVSDIELTVTAYDDQGLSAAVKSHLTTETGTIGAGAGWDNTVGMRSTRQLRWLTCLKPARFLRMWVSSQSILERENAVAP